MVSGVKIVRMMKEKSWRWSLEATGSLLFGGWADVVGGLGERLGACGSV
jgi:hypothetical protein